MIETGERRRNDTPTGGRGERGIEQTYGPPALSQVSDTFIADTIGDINMLWVS